MTIWFFFSSFSFQVFNLMREQERSRLAELAAEKAHHEAIQSQADIVSDKLNRSTVSISFLLVHCSNHVGNST